MKVISSKCPICKSSRVYINYKNMIRSTHKPCRSCANSISRGGPGNVKPKNGKKLCNKCRKLHSVNVYSVYKTGRLHSLCNECKKESFRKYQKTIGRFDRYGITKDEYDIMYTKQKGKCLLCQKTHDILCIDHNKKSGKIRGLLCRTCNTGIGLLHENIKILKSAIKYLEN